MARQSQPQPIIIARPGAPRHLRRVSTTHLRRFPATPSLPQRLRRRASVLQFAHTVTRVASVWLALGIVLFGQTTPEARQALPVRHPEGLVHGFLGLKTLDGKALADGDLIQNVRGDRVTTRLLLGGIH